MEKPPKIVQVIKNYPPAIGGMEGQAYLLAQSLLSRGLRVEVLTAEPWSLKSNTNLIIKRAPLVKDNTAKTAVLLFGVHVLYSLAKKILRNENFIVHGFGSFGIEKVVFYLLKKFFGLKYIIQIGGMLDRSSVKQYYTCPLHKRIPQKTIRHAHALIVLDHLTKTNFIKLGFDPERIHIIKNGIHIPQIEGSIADRVKAKLGSHNGILLYVGRVVEEKGVFHLIDAFQLLSQKYPSLRLWIIGDGKDLSRLKKVAEEKKIKMAYFWGAVNRSVLKKFYASSDIFILPSYREGIPNVLLEAMSYQLPIISTNVGAIPTVIDPHKNGILIPPKDTASLVEGVETFLESPDLAVALGKNARSKVIREFSLQKYYDSHIWLYNLINTGS